MTTLLYNIVALAFTSYFPLFFGLDGLNGIGVDFTLESFKPRKHEPRSDKGKTPFIHIFGMRQNESKYCRLSRLTRINSEIKSSLSRERIAVSMNYFSSSDIPN